MNIFIKAKKELYKIIKSTYPNIRYDIYYISKFADISLYIYSEMDEIKDLSVIIINSFTKIGLTVKVTIDNNYINIYFNNKNFIESLKDDEEPIETFKLNIISDGNYRSNLITDIYSEFYRNLNCQVSDYNKIIDNGSTKNIIISSNNLKRLDNVTYFIYEKIDEKNIDLELLKFAAFTYNLKKQIRFNFEKLKDICYNNNLFLIYYVYNHSDRIIKHSKKQDIDGTPYLEIELLKILNHFYVVKEYSINSLRIDLMMNYLFKICKIYLNIYNLNDFNINTVRLKIIKKIKYLIMSITRMLNIKLIFNI